MNGAAPGIEAERTSWAGLGRENGRVDSDVATAALGDITGLGLVYPYAKASRFPRRPRLKWPCENTQRDTPLRNGDHDPITKAQMDPCLALPSRMTRDAEVIGIATAKEVTTLMMEGNQETLGVVEEVCCCEYIHGKAHTANVRK